MGASRTFAIRPDEGVKILAIVRTDEENKTIQVEVDPEWKVEIHVTSQKDAVAVVEPRS